MLRLLRYFFGLNGVNPWMVLFCLVMANVAQGFGIASLLPLISTLGSGQHKENSVAGDAVVQMLAYLHLQPEIGVLLAIVVVAVLLKATLTVIAMVYVGRAVATVSQGLRLGLIDALLKARWSYFTSKATGTIVNGVGPESSVSGIVYIMISRFLTSIIQVVIYLGVAFAVSWKMASLSILIGALIAGALHVFVRMAERAGRHNIKRSRELVTRLSDAIIGIKPLKAMAREQDFGRLFERKTDQIREAVCREFVSKNILSNLQEPLLMLILAGGFYVVITYGNMPIGTVLVTGLLLQRTVNAAGKLQSQYQEAIASESAYRSVRNLTREASQQAEPPFGSRQPTLETACEFCDVTFSYGRGPVLQNFNLQIPARKMTLLIGPSGTGKTTVTDLLLGFYRPNTGEIRVDGVPLTEIDIHLWRRSIGYVPQELILLHDTILANITLGNPHLTEADAWEALRRAGAEDFIAALPEGLNTTVGEKGSLFSGGQRQRISIARALVHRPRLLILDEVTSALDIETEQAICENLRALAGQVTILAISHRQAWIDIADDVVSLEVPEPNEMWRTTATVP